MACMVHGPRSNSTTVSVHTHFPLASCLVSTSNSSTTRPLDMSTHTYVLRRLLALKLVESPESITCILNALADSSLQASGIQVLLHCSRLNTSFCHALIRGGAMSLLLNVPSAQVTTRVCSPPLVFFYSSRLYYLVSSVSLNQQDERVRFVR